MGEAQGKKVDPSAIAVQAIEAQPAFGQIKPMRGKVLACTEQRSRRRVSYQSVRTRDPGASGKEEKTWRTERRPSVDETNQDQRQRSEPSGLSSTDGIVTARSKRSREGRYLSVTKNDSLPFHSQPREDGAERSPVFGHRSQAWSQG
jgi:hypothetical protein